MLGIGAYPLLCITRAYNLHCEHSVLLIAIDIDVVSEASTLTSHSPNFAYTSKSAVLFHSHRL